jgi:hypothetical protein
VVDPAFVMPFRPTLGFAAVGAVAIAAVGGCVPPGSASPTQEAGSPASPAVQTSMTPATPTTAPLSADILRAPFEDDFERAAATGDAAFVDPGPEWAATSPGAWRIEDGRLCGEHAHNHGLWLKRALPVDARIEFDAVSQSPDGDLKAEYWGDGRSYATALSYTNATSYLTIFGGWHNKFHVLARLNEHGNDRKEIEVDPNSDDPREKPVVAGQLYHFKVERADGRTIKWWVDGNEMLSWTDASPLVGAGHDHFAFNDWDAKLCFDNVKVVPLP